MMLLPLLPPSRLLLPEALLLLPVALKEEVGQAALSGSVAPMPAGLQFSVTCCDQADASGLQQPKLHSLPKLSMASDLVCWGMSRCSM